MANNLESLGVDVAEAARLTGLSRATMYGLLMSGVVPSAKIGARRIVPVASLRAWLEQQAAGPSDE